MKTVNELKEYELPKLTVIELTVPDVLDVSDETTNDENAGTWIP